MELHHQESINNLVKEFKKDPAILALILGGSIAHGYAKPDSDIDVAIVIETSDFQKRKKENNLVYNNKDLCTYENGYIDGKYIDCELLKLIAQKGSEPARYAFKGGNVLFSRIDCLEDLLAAVVKYPVEKKEERIKRFVAQILAWRWYFSEAVKKQNQYLVILSIQKLILIGSRIVLAANELLYPYHKWLIQELQTAERKPPTMMADIDELLKSPSLEKVNDYCDKILSFIGINEKDLFWPNLFMKDSELNWLDKEPPVDDL